MAIRLTPGEGALVLIGFAEAMAAIESAWSLQEAGFRVAAFRRAGRRPALSRVRGVEIHDVPPPEANAAGAVHAVRKLCEQLSPAALLPLDDLAVWVAHQLEDSLVPIAGGTGFAADCALDKSLQLEIAAKAGLPVPQTHVVSDLASIDQTSFPVMVKPSKALYEVAGVLTRPTGVVCASAEEFARATAKSWPGTVLVQPLIHGTGEGLFGHVGARGVSAWSAHRRVRMVNPQGSASSACESMPVDSDLLEPAQRFLETIGWHGMFMLEFLRDSSGKPWFMELNGRAWGSMPLARRRGFEYPAWTVRAALDPSFTPSPPSRPPDIRCRNVALEIMHLAFVARGPQSSASTQWPKLSKAVRDVCTFRRGDRLYNWNRSQPGVFIADMMETLRAYLRKIAGRR
jgi:predicted ATP-grasp superfamily ATP-dependent carboligase